MLSSVLLELLREWYRMARPQGWLFPGQNPASPMSTRRLTRACHAAAHMAEFAKRVSPHTLRHSFATHFGRFNLVRDGSALPPIASELAHRSNCGLGHIAISCQRRRGSECLLPKFRLLV